jgi:ribosomal-protein-alanine N-acetyltransferase
MTPAEMAQLHRAEPTGQRAWSEAEFSAMLSASNALSVTCDAGFAVGQVIVDEAELFLIITKPEHRKQGVGRRILATFEQQAFQNAVRRIILEVADTNTAARALYSANGYQQIAVRKNYYTFPNGSHADAIVMEKHLQKTAENTE